MSLDRIIESRIQEAMDAGAFSNLEGTGKPLPALDQDGLAGDNWMAFRVLRNGGLLPGWLDLAKEIERDLERLERIDLRHERLADAVRRDGWSPSLRVAVARAREDYAELGRAIRKKQDQFNISAPALASERPGIWVERQLERLDARVQGTR